MRSIEEDKLNSDIRKIKLMDLLAHNNQESLRIIEKRWRFPYPTVENFNGDMTAKHIAVIGSYGAGKSEIVRQVKYSHGLKTRVFKINQFYTCHIITTSKFERRVSTIFL